MTIRIPVSLFRPEVESEDERLPVVAPDERLPEVESDERFPVVDFPEVRLGVSYVGVDEIQFVSFNTIRPLEVEVRGVTVLFPTTPGTLSSKTFTR